MHRRYQPQRHAFRYRIFWLAIDLDELSTLDKTIGGFGHNRFALLSIHDHDYGLPAEGSIQEGIADHLRRSGIQKPVSRIVLMTIPRVLGYVFNPVSFYLCYGADGSLAALVAEVRNTFGEMHHYVLRPIVVSYEDSTKYECRMPKEFYVSPFFDVEGEYVLRFGISDRCFDMRIQLYNDKQLLFYSDMVGTGRPITTFRLITVLCFFPFFAATIMLRIHWQALLLFMRKRLPVYRKSEPMSPATCKGKRDSIWFRLRRRIVNRASRSR